MNKKIRTFFALPLIATAIFFLFIAFPYVKDFGLTSVVQESPVLFQKKTDLARPLLKGEKITAKVRVSENNLGILLVRFVKVGKGSDTLIFRLKKEGDKKWYYENKYLGEQFQDNKYFTFGFPSIANAKNNVYVLELESLAGTKKNGISLSDSKSQIAFVYSYSKHELANLQTLLPFIFKKAHHVFKSVNYLQIVFVFVLSYLLSQFFRSNSFLAFRKNPKKVFKKQLVKLKSKYLSFQKNLFVLSKKLNHRFVATKIYLLLFNTNMKRRFFISLFIFFLALLYRYSAGLVNPSLLFYATLGGGGDYDQFMRASTCALQLCSLIIHQNLLVESLILGSFHHLFGFTGGLKAYVYVMLIVSSIVATLPYLLLSRRTWFSAAGIIGSLLLATSDFLTQTALNFPPDNGSLFLFSLLFIVYLLTMQYGTIRWLFAFGLLGFIDGMFKAFFLINDVAALALFVPVFFYEKTRGVIFKRKNIKILLLALLPLLIFVILYSAWEYFVQIKFTAPYFLRMLIETGGSNFRIETAFYNRGSGKAEQDLILQLFYLFISGLVMIKRIIILSDLKLIFLAPIFLGLLFFSFIYVKSKMKLSPVKLGTIMLLSFINIALLVSIRNNYLGIHHIFPGEYIYISWTLETYVGIFLFVEILILFIFNFKYQAFKLALPILPYVIMLIILTKNAPWERLLVHVIVWTIILFSFLIDWMLHNDKKASALKRFWIGPIILILFIFFYTIPKTSSMVVQLLSGINNTRGEVAYLRWVNSVLPKEAIILAGGKSDLVMLGDSIKSSIIYNTLWSGAVLIRQEKLPPEVSPGKWNIIAELKNKNNFKKNRYIILEDDISLWRDRVAGVQDNLFSTSSAALLNTENYKVKLYKSNKAMNKSLYELTLR